MGKRTMGKGRPIWTRRWVLLVVAAVLLFGSGVALGAGSNGDGGQCRPAASQVQR